MCTRDWCSCLCTCVCGDQRSAWVSTPVALHVICWDKSSNFPDLICQDLKHREIKVGQCICNYWGVGPDSGRSLGPRGLRPAWVMQWNRFFKKIKPTWKVFHLWSFCPWTQRSGLMVAFGHFKGISHTHKELRFWFLIFLFRNLEHQLYIHFSYLPGKFVNWDSGILGLWFWSPK